MNKKTRFSTLRTVLLCLLLIAAPCSILYATNLLSGDIIPEVYPKGVPVAPETMRAFTVMTGSSGDFPTAPNLSVKSQKEQLDQMITFADTYGFNTIFFEAIPEGDAFYRSELLPASAYWMGKQGAFTFFDPLGYLTNAAKSKNIQVFATVDPFSVSDQPLAARSPAAKNPDWLTDDGFLNPAESGVQKLLENITAELTENYDIAGVLLHRADDARLESTKDYAKSFAAISKKMSDALHDKNTQRLGILLSGATPEWLNSPLADNSLDFVLPANLPDPLAETDALIEELTAWQSLSDRIAYYPVHNVDDKTVLTHTVDNSGYLEAQYGADGVVISSYSTLATDTRIAAVSLAASFIQAPPQNTPTLTFEQTFAISRPTETISLSSDWKTYYITGTSDPNGEPVLYEGQELERSSGGLWGVQVELAYGENSFTVAQGIQRKTVTIKRADPSKVVPLTDIKKSSAYPDSSEMVLAGEKLQLSCIAPAGGTMTAKLGELTAELTAPAANAGTAVTYQGTLDISSLAKSGQVTGLGEVTYQLHYNGLNSFQNSSGIVYVAGVGATPIAKMNSFAAMVNKNAKDDGDYLSILRKECVDVITGTSGNYYELSMGGYITKSAVDIPEGKVTAVSKVSKIAVQQTPKGEKLVISNDRRPAYVGNMDETALTLTLYNVDGWETMNPLALKGELFETISAQINEENDSVTLTFTLKADARLLGWDVSFEGDDMHVYLRSKPEIHVETPKPLSDVTVVLDPGHGGADPGALGVPGLSGATEKMMNLANSYAIRSRLEAMGAQVHLVHEDGDVSLNSRLEFAQKMDADLFISSHHNSVAVTSDGSKATGIEVYYWNDGSASFANQIGENLAGQSERKLRGADQSFYRVTMMTACPAVLVESGFICNPMEYEQLATPFAMFRYGNAVADAVLQFLLPEQLTDVI